MTEQQIARRRKFLQIGKLTKPEACTGDLQEHYFGGQQEFEIKCRAVQDGKLNSHFPSAPAMKTQQWERAVKR